MSPVTLPMSHARASSGERAAGAGPTQLHTGRLILTLTDPREVLDVERLIEGLSQCGFLGDPVSVSPEAASRAEGERTFHLGVNILSLLSFAGCAVQIRDTRSDDTGCFSSVRIPPISPYPRGMIGRNTRPPRCAGCRAPLADWRALVDHWATHPNVGLRCPACGETRPPWLWDWKRQGGWGRVFVCIEEIFPDEAVPTPVLFDSLIRISGVGWRHFYIQD